MSALGYIRPTEKTVEREDALWRRELKVAERRWRAAFDRLKVPSELQGPPDNPQWRRGLLGARAKPSATAKAVTARGAKKPPMHLVRALATSHAFAAGISPELLMSPVHSWRVAHPRMRVWKDLRDRGYSLPGIGAVFDRDHTTIMSGLKRLAKLDLEAALESRKRG